ncbi:hypothetical protein TeGR_g3123 [Tetraparma gracilis]|uniref:Uncharacterized protein n=1 Tax=Tetraparma gracilis TaxID=2962635 RepID=A0ABQ6MPM0_9STRA|nr:hypothetical protein TeGR_g3123 [Tetraparma gracilis]
MAVKGPFPKKIIKRHLASYKEMGIEEKTHFTDDGESKFIEIGVDKVTGNAKMEEKNIPLIENEVVRLLIKKIGSSKGADAKEKAKEKHEVIKLGKMIEAILTLDSAKRPTVLDVMKHDVSEPGLTDAIVRATDPVWDAETGDGEAWA